MPVDSHAYMYDLKGYAIPPGIVPVVVGYSHGSNLKAAALAKEKGWPFVLGIAPQTAIKHGAEGLGLENPSERMTPFWQAALVGGSAIMGSLVPIAPFFFLPVHTSILTALALSLAALFFVGAYKSQSTSGKWLMGGLELMLIGGAAALAGWLVGVLFQPLAP
jgi:VIT1/CCC1 family predicted Fe2+/Mn2+ transporter